MAILGIENRTENWKTAQVFAPFFEDADARKRLARKRLAAKLLGKPVKSDVSLELFWYGFRDYVHEQGGRNQISETDIAGRYDRLFPKLHEKVQGFADAENWQLVDRNYSTMDKTRLLNNLIHTEIDIVLESRHHLFIGEAKSEVKFGENASVLKHQLVRQYVTAKIVLDVTGRKKRIVPFVVGNSAEKLCEHAQVQFMIERLGMRCENVLEWGDVRGLAGG